MSDGRDPMRLLDDPAMDQGLRDALRQASSHVPPIDTAAGLARLEGAISGGGAVGGGLGGGPIAAGAVALALLGGGLWYATQGEPAGEPTAAETASSQEIAEPAVAAETPAEPAEVAAPHATETGTETTTAIEPATAPIAETAVPAADRARPAVRPREGAPSDAARTDEASLAREMARIAEARRALDRDPARTLALVDESRREVPRSLLAEERDALRVLALDALGREREAGPLARRFLAAHPTSPFAERVRRATEAP